MVGGGWVCYFGFVVLVVLVDCRVVVVWLLLVVLMVGLVWVVGVVEKEGDREKRWKGREMSSFIFILLFDG